MRYRYRPKQEEKTMHQETEHPNADDYRNRAERAEAELAEVKRRLARFETEVESLNRVLDNNLFDAERIRKLEALICDTLLDNAGGV